jgi:hypothetical protein
MKPLLLAGAASAALALALAQPAAAQDMPGMSMPHADHPQPQSQQPAPAAPTAEPAPQATAPAQPMAGMDHGDHGDGDMGGMAGMEGMDHDMTGALGSYPMNREASGTSWQPDVSEHGGIHTMSGPWTFMSHATINGVFDHQGGPRGDDKTYVAGMVMFAARRDLPNMDTLNFRAMLSPDPWMGKNGYPLLLAAGETADGANTLVDRQHPHDLFMELSASYTHRFSDQDSVFVYAGLPGEPAFGPPAFMHRLSTMDSPEAPISHHWFDSTHITFGVLTGGWVHNNFKIEASAFKGREPDQFRFNIESPKFDSASVRLSWNPTENWSVQGSWAHLKSPEALDPTEDETRYSASAIYTRKVGQDGWWSTTGGVARKERSDGVDLNAAFVETAYKPNFAWTVFARTEWVQSDELLTVGGVHGPKQDVGKVSVGAIHDWRLIKHVTFGVGGLYSYNFLSSDLKPSYGGNQDGAMGFIRIKIGG